jgi:hypothetical protein
MTQGKQGSKKKNAKRRKPELNKEPLRDLNVPASGKDAVKGASRGLRLPRNRTG